MRSRIAFETDAVNDYFSRSIDPGTFTLYVHDGGARKNIAKEFKILPAILIFQNGIANLSIKFPENSKVGDKVKFVAVVNDATQQQPIENILFSFDLQEPAEPTKRQR